ncbi:MAG: sugar transferase [Clostridia bacterium]|nr:sugar transferase [Clostridia bacterium]
MSYLTVKRILDILFSLVLLTLLSPLLLLVALLIKLGSQGPVLFKQDRIGYRTKPFQMLKFRSMVQGAAQMGTGQYSFKGDPRVTRIGHLIRMTSIDELPQLINILKGDMSFIGPRPTLLFHPFPIEQFPAHALRRFSVRPGITGWAQVNGRKELSWDKRFEYDLDYVDRCSLALDFKIFLKTFGKLVSFADNVNTGKTA